MALALADKRLEPHIRENDDQNVQLAHFWDIYQDEGLGQLAEDVGLFKSFSPAPAAPTTPPIRTRDLKYDNFLKTDAVDPIFMGLKPNSSSSLGLKSRKLDADSLGMGDYGGKLMGIKLEAPSQQILRNPSSASPRPHKRRKTALAPTPAGTIPFQSSKLQSVAVNLNTRVASGAGMYGPGRSGALSGSASGAAPPAFFSPPPFSSGGSASAGGLQPHARLDRAGPGRSSAAGVSGEKLGFTAQSRRFSSSSQASLSPLPLFPGAGGAGQSSGRPKRTSSLAALKAQLEANAQEELKNKKKKGSRSRVQKGLRHFSLKVCEKVEEQQVTTYNKVADELVKDLTNPETAGIGNKKVYDEKNIRRRVYDALNVLMAMGIISKDKKRITWIGLPNTVNKDVHSLHQEKQERLDRITRKRAQLSDLLTQQVCKKNLAQLNSGAATPSMGAAARAGRRDKEARLTLPFILVNTTRETVIQCEMSDDRRSLFFDFSDAFSILEDADVLRFMKLSRTAPWDLPRMVPREVCSFYPQEDILEPSKQQRS